jgi:pimeloyl-ACP methyl ester carboxylesterase
MSRYILVHGSWHGGWCWDKVVPLLKAQEQEPVTLDLLGHWPDNSVPHQDITLDRYVAQVTSILSENPEPAVLVGHSFGGVVISQAAERMPGSVKAMIFVCAFMPSSGESLLDWATKDLESLVLQNLVNDPPETLVVKPEARQEAFYGDCSEEDATWALSQLVPEPAPPLATPVDLTPASYGKLDRLYIHCTQDKGVTPWLQEAMVKANPCNTATLSSAHSPWLSQPENLTEILLKFA